MFNRVGVDIFSQKRGMRTRLLSAVGLLLNSCKVCMPLTITWSSWWTLGFPPPNQLWPLFIVSSCWMQEEPEPMPLAANQMSGGLLMVRFIVSGPLCMGIFTQLWTWKSLTRDRDPSLPGSGLLPAIGLCLKSAFVMIVYTPFSLSFLLPIFNCRTLTNSAQCGKKNLWGKDCFWSCNILILEFWGRQFHKCMLFFSSHVSVKWQGSGPFAGSCKCVLHESLSKNNNLFRCKMELWSIEEMRAHGMWRDKRSTGKHTWSGFREHVRNGKNCTGMAFPRSQQATLSWRLVNWITTKFLVSKSTVSLWLSLYLFVLVFWQLAEHESLQDSRPSDICCRVFLFSRCLLAFTQRTVFCIYVPVPSFRSECQKACQKL